jgi:hypothetical protein
VPVAVTSARRGERRSRFLLGPPPYGKTGPIGRDALAAGMAGCPDIGQARAHGLREVVVAVVCGHELLEEGLESQQGDLLGVAEPAEHLCRQDDVWIGEAGVDDDPFDRRVGEQRCHQLFATQPTSGLEHLFLRRRDAVEGGHGLDEPAVEHRVHSVRRAEARVR